MDVQSYLDRLKLKRPGKANLERLRLLHQRHLLTVPFENLDIHRGVPIVLDEERILQKIVARRRGGFCYELNAAFGWLLQQLGYQVTLLSAEVGRKEGGFGIPFDHMVLQVKLKRPYLADVGFGDSFRQPLPLVPGKEVEQSGDRYRLRVEGGWWFLERRRPGAAERFEPQYRFTLVPRRLEDFTPGCRYHQTSPQSSFTRETICTVALADGRLTLHPDRVVSTRNGIRTETPISDRNSWVKALKGYFGIQLS